MGPGYLSVGAAVVVLVLGAGAAPPSLAPALLLHITEASR